MTFDSFPKVQVIMELYYNGDGVYQWNRLQNPLLNSEGFPVSQEEYETENH